MNKYKKVNLTAASVSGSTPRDIAPGSDPLPVSVVVY